ncbi:hypothetical protein E4U55_003251 [Claviceps digitariae]|nr:hypothetical protein E4U55_003251 [Claviceps digitariae]
MAHFGLAYPPWRADTLSEAGEEKYSQWTYPCAGVPYQTGNITDWPLTGGRLQLNLHHPWTYVFVNLGLGPNATNFNVSLTPSFWNVTGKGTLCVDKLALPSEVQALPQVRDGELASLQVVTVGESGSALYNCADIRFGRDVGEGAGGNCTSSPGVVVQRVMAGNVSGNGSTGGSTVGGDTKSDGGVVVGADVLSLLTVVGLASVFALGM